MAAGSHFLMLAFDVCARTQANCCLLTGWLVHWVNLHIRA